MMKRNKNINEITVTLLNDGVDKNGRTYPKELLEKIVLDINNRDRNYGEIGDTVEPIVNLSKISHQYQNARIKENSLIVDIKILDTPKGIELKQVINKNSIFGCRGIGIVNENNIVENYKLISIDYIL